MGKTYIEFNLKQKMPDSFMKGKTSVLITNDLKVKLWLFVRIAKSSL